MTNKFYKDNREFIKALEANDDLVTIHQEVDWDLEMGAIVRRVCEKKSASPYFKKIKDYPGFEALGAPLATYRRLAIAMGMSPNAPVPEISDEYVKRTTGAPVKSIRVDRKKAPCKENILMGDEADLFKLRVPWSMMGMEEGI